MSAHSLFHLGYDTHAIATRLGLAEAQAHKRVTVQRDVANSTHTEFERRA